MSATGLDVFDATLHKTNTWLTELIGAPESPAGGRRERRVSKA